MRVSNYTVNVQIDKEKNMLYNTWSRKYYVYNNKDKDRIKFFLDNINKGIYSEEEVSLFQELMNKKIIVSDKINEVKEIKLLETQKNVMNDEFHITIFLTNNCNFNCEYCTQEHIKKNLEDDVSQELLSFIRKITKQVKILKVDWFGGEPLLQYEKMKKLLCDINNICQENNCSLISGIVTNGYLLNEQRIKELKELSVKSMQITVDGNIYIHDKRRTLVDGTGTYEKIYNNILLVAKLGIYITLRINIDEENMKYSFDILDEIPEEYRKKIVISVSNIFQVKKKISTFLLYKKAMELGYVYAERWNDYLPCAPARENSITINTNGELLLCTNTDENEKAIGKLELDGNIKIWREKAEYKMKKVSATENIKCRECKQLPWCISMCKYMRMKDNTKCIGKRGDGLSIEEKALLDYYYDLLY